MVSAVSRVIITPSPSEHHLTASVQRAALFPASRSRIAIQSSTSILSRRIARAPNYLATFFLARGILPPVYVAVLELGMPSRAGRIGPNQLPFGALTVATNYISDFSESSYLEDSNAVSSSNKCVYESSTVEDMVAGIDERPEPPGGSFESLSPNGACALEVAPVEDGLKDEVGVAVEHPDAVLGQASASETPLVRLHHCQRRIYLILTLFAARSHSSRSRLSEGNEGINVRLPVVPSCGIGRGEMWTTDATGKANAELTDRIGAHLGALQRKQAKRLSAERSLVGSPKPHTIIHNTDAVATELCRYKFRVRDNLLSALLFSVSPPINLTTTSLGAM
ncbi:hypothetical protein GY45DRAFT_1341315, partial [Cubamyces sp. BRFM 1775]